MNPEGAPLAPSGVAGMPWPTRQGLAPDRACVSPSGADDDHQNAEFWVNEVHQVVVVSVFFEIAVILIRPVYRPRLHCLEPEAVILKAPVIAVRDPKMMLPAEVSTEFLFWNPLASA